MRVRPALTVSDSQGRKTHKLARKNLWATGLLSFFLPFAGYLYTGRYGLAAISFAVLLIGGAAAEESELGTLIVVFLMVGSTIENMGAVLGARSKFTANNPLLQPDDQHRDLRIELLKLAKRQGEMTLADFVITTGQSVDEVRSTLVELEKHDLMRSSNRDSDGAVVYRAVL